MQVWPGSPVIFSVVSSCYNPSRNARSSYCILYIVLCILYSVYCTLYIVWKTYSFDTLYIGGRLCGQSSYQRSSYQSTNLSIPQQMSPQASKTGRWHFLNGLVFSFIKTKTKTNQSTNLSIPQQMSPQASKTGRCHS